MEPTKPVGPITYEPFRAAFTGTLSSYVDAGGVRWRLKKPYLKVRKGQHFMLAIDRAEKTCRFIPVIAPRIQWRNA